MAVLSLLMLAPMAEAEPLTRLEKLSVKPNPAGFQVGFWSNYRRMPEVLKDFGLRPIERVDFTKWATVETKPGVYDWSKCFNNSLLAHRCGSAVINNINVSFSREINPKGKHAIPEFYPARITNPDTRAAAKRFVAAYTRELLTRVGEAILVIDYELMWNCRPETPALRQEYRDWYVEACDAAREAAREIGATDRLRLIPIVNSNPLSAADRFIGGKNPPDHQPQQWLLDVVAHSDGLGIDTYAHDPSDPASAETTLQILRFWKEHYAQGKPIYIAENGFTTVKEVLPGFQSDAHHARGTEAQQQAYFTDLLTRLPEWNRKGAPLDNQVRSLCIWMYQDQKSPTKDDAKQIYFGLRRLDGSPKPALESVRSAIAAIESNPDTSPWLTSGREPATIGKGITLHYGSSLDHDILRGEFEVPDGAKRARLTIEAGEGGAVIASLNGTAWSYGLIEAGIPLPLELQGSLKPGTNVVELRFTGGHHPFEQIVHRLDLSLDREAPQKGSGAPSANPGIP